MNVLPVRKGGKGGKRRIAPVLISPSGNDSSSSVFATASMQSAAFADGGSNSSQAAAKRPRMSESSPQHLQPARQLQASGVQLQHGSPQRQQQQRQAQHILPVLGAAAGAAAPRPASLVAAAPAAAGDAFVREIGQAPNVLLVEASADRPAAAGRAAAAGSGSTSTVRVSKGSDVEWEDTVHSVISAVGGDGTERGLLAVGCTDGSLYTYTRRGRRLMPCIALGGGGVAVVEVKAGAKAESGSAAVESSSLLVVTVDGSLYLWAFKPGAQPTKLLKTSLAPLLSNPTAAGLGLSRALVTRSGVVVAVLSNGHTFGFDCSLDAWLRLADDHFHESDFHSDLPAAALGNGDGEKTATDLATVHAAAATAARAVVAASAPAHRVAALMQAGSSGSRKKRSLAHLESLLGSAVLLGRGAEGFGTAPTAAAQQEYKDWLKVYARRLAEDGAVSGVAIAKVRELCEELLGPPASRGEGAAAAAAGGDAWDAQTALGLGKRALLKEVVLPMVAAHSRISGFQRLVSEYKLELEALESSG